MSMSQATTLDLSSFDTSKVTTGGNVCNSQATALDLSSFDTSNVELWLICHVLKQLQVMQELKQMQISLTAVVVNQLH